MPNADLPRPSERTTTRRSWLRRLLAVLTASGTLLFEAPPASAQSCNDWIRCGMGGCLCSCRGGSDSRCPDGTVPGTEAWYACCYDRARNKVWYVRYTDCCANTPPPSCPSNCYCDNAAQPSWCGTAGKYVVCTRAVIIDVC